MTTSSVPGQAAAWRDVAPKRLGYSARLAVLGLAVIPIVLLSLLAEAGVQGVPVADIMFRLTHGASSLKSARIDEGVWRAYPVDSEGDVGRYASSALDPETGVLHVAYCDETNGDLKYARRDGAVWQVQTVDGEGDVGAYASLALIPADSRGSPTLTSRTSG